MSLSTRFSVGLSVGLLAGLLMPAVTIASTFSVESFTVLKNVPTAPFFQDQFDDGTPPPSGPNGPSTYFTRGAPGPESGGKLTLDTALGDLRISSITGDPLRVQVSILRTNIDPGDTQGLRRDDDIAVIGLWDLIEPDQHLDRYGVRFSDFVAGTANDVVEVGVRKFGSETRVDFREADFATSSNTVLESFVLSTEFATYEQISLRLDSAADSDLVTAAFTLIDADNTANNFEYVFRATADIFSG